MFCSFTGPNCAVNFRKNSLRIISSDAGIIKKQCWSKHALKFTNAQITRPLKSNRTGDMNHEYKSNVVLMCPRARLVINVCLLRTIFPICIYLVLRGRYSWNMQVVIKRGYKQSIFQMWSRPRSQICTFFSPSLQREIIYLLSLFLNQIPTWQPGDLPPPMGEVVLPVSQAPTLNPHYFIWLWHLYTLLLGGLPIHSGKIKALLNGTPAFNIFILQ